MRPRMCSMYIYQTLSSRAWWGLEMRLEGKGLGTSRHFLSHVRHHVRLCYKNLLLLYGIDDLLDSQLLYLSLLQVEHSSNSCL